MAGAAHAQSQARVRALVFVFCGHLALWPVRVWGWLRCHRLELVLPQRCSSPISPSCAGEAPGPSPLEATVVASDVMGKVVVGKGVSVAGRSMSELEGD